jgi:small GTP-binding protein
MISNINEHKFKIVLIGPENSGKSALLNAIFGRYVSEVSEIGGTTKRPVKKFWGKLKCGRTKKEPKFVNVSFVDLGGLYVGEKKSPIMVGKILEETYKEMEDADVIIHVVDGEKGLSKSFEKLHHLLKYRYQKPIIVVVNKCDLIDENRMNELKNYIENRLQNRVLFTSAITYCGITELINIIIALLKK